MIENKIKKIAEESVPDVLEKIKARPEYRVHIEKNQSKNSLLGRFGFRLAFTFSFLFLMFFAFATSSNQNNNVYAMEYTSNGYHIKVTVNQAGEILEIIPMSENTKIMFQENSLSTKDESVFETEINWQAEDAPNVPENVRERIEERVQIAKERREERPRNDSVPDHYIPNTKP